MFTVPLGDAQSFVVDTRDVYRCRRNVSCNDLIDRRTNTGGKKNNGNFFFFFFPSREGRKFWMPKRWIIRTGKSVISWRNDVLLRSLLLPLHVVSFVCVGGSTTHPLVVRVCVGGSVRRQRESQCAHGRTARARAPIARAVRFCAPETRRCRIATMPASRSHAVREQRPSNFRARRRRGSPALIRPLNLPSASQPGPARQGQPSRPS